MNSELDLGSLGIYFAVVAAVSVALYVYTAVIGSILARKTATPSAWMAWVPICNMVLLCRIGRRPGIAVLGLFVPLLNLVMLVYIFLGVARVRNKPDLAAWLMLVPLVNFLVLAWFASGDAAAPSAPYASAATRVPPASQHCPSCNDLIEPGETFCGNCGRPFTSSPPPVSTAAAASAPAGPPPVPVAAGGAGRFVTGLVSAVFLAAGVWYGVTRYVTPMLSPGAASTALVPQRKSGILTEFPVDTNRQSPAKPVAVTSTNLRPGRRQAQPAKLSLPPGVNIQTLAASATSVTSATYKEKLADPPVVVHVLEASAPDSVEGMLTNAAVQGGNGVSQSTGVELKSPDGDIYRGHKVSFGIGAVVYILAKMGEAIVIMIYSPEAAGAALADRLAANVGNGDGLYDYSGVSGAVTMLPPEPPAGLILKEMNSYASADVTGIQELQKTIGGEAASLKRYVPDRFISAVYADSSNRDWKLLAGDFGAAWRAWMTWNVVRWSSGLTGVESISLSGLDGLTLQQDAERFFVWRDGARIFLISAPRAEPVDRVATLARSLRF